MGGWEGGVQRGGCTAPDVVDVGVFAAVLCCMGFWVGAGPCGGMVVLLAVSHFCFSCSLDLV